jgi:hypothetical protein
MDKTPQETINLKMTQSKFHCLTKTIDGIKQTIMMTDRHSAFTKAILEDLKTVKEIITTSRKG